MKERRKRETKEQEEYVERNRRRKIEYNNVPRRSPCEELAGERRIEEKNTVWKRLRGEKSEKKRI